MKILSSAIAVLTFGAPISAQLEQMLYTTEVVRATENIDSAAEALMHGDDTFQPPCGHITDNYVSCFTLPEDIDETVWVEHPVVPADITLGDLKGTPDYDLAFGMLQAIRDATLSCDELGPYQLATYPWLDQNDVTVPIMATSLVKGFNAVSSFGTSGVSVWNTFSDTEVTGGAQVIYDYRDAVLNAELEFPAFPMNMPPLEGGFYDIDISAKEITYTLIDNQSATNVIFPDGTFDRYYFIMPETVTSVEVVSSDNYVVIADILPDDTAIDTFDAFGTGLMFPSSLGGNVIRVQFVGGTNMAELGQQIVLSYTLDQETETFACASGPIVEEPIVQEMK